MMKNIQQQLPEPPAGKCGWPWNIERIPLAATMPGKQEWPRISVTVPSYNQAQYLEETLRSILLQGYPNLELFVMDGGSSDGSKAILEKYDAWIDAWVSEADHGQSQAINKGWQRSTGTLVAYLNSDDFYLPGALEKVALAWNNERGSALIAGAVAFVDATSRRNRVNTPHLNTSSPLDLSTLEISEWYIPQQSSFFVRPALDRAGCWLREDLHYVMDRELMYRLCRFGQVILLTDTLAADRKHAAAKRQKDRLVMYREDGKAMQYCDWGGHTARLRRQQVARERLAQGHWLTAQGENIGIQKLASIFKAISLRPAYLKQVEPLNSVLRVIRSLHSNSIAYKKEVH